MESKKSKEHSIPTWCRWSCNYVFCKQMSFITSKICGQIETNTRPRKQHAGTVMYNEEGSSAAMQSRQPAWCTCASSRWVLWGGGLLCSGWETITTIECNYPAASRTHFIIFYQVLSYLKCKATCSRAAPRKAESKGAVSTYYVTYRAN